MSLINDMLQDKQRRAGSDKPVTLTTRDVDTKRQKRSPPDSDSYLHSKFDSVAMYNPYARGEQSTASSVKNKVSQSLFGRYAFLVGAGLGLAAFLHYAIIPSKSVIGQMVRSDPFYATASLAWNKAYGLFQPSLPASQIEVATVAPAPERLPRITSPRRPAPPVDYANSFPADSSKSSAVSQYIRSGLLSALGAESIQRHLPSNTLQADEIYKIAQGKESAELAKTQLTERFNIQASREETSRAIERKIDEALSDAENYVRIGASTKAIERLEQVLKAHPENIRLRAVMAGLLIDEQRYDAAEKIITIGQKLHPQNTTYRRLLAQVYAQTEHPEKAIEVLLTVPPQLQEDPDYYSLLAAMYQQQGRHDLAAQLYTELVQLFPESARWWTGLGISLEATQRPQEALNSYMRSLYSSNLEPQLRNFVSKRVKQLSSRDDLLVGESAFTGTAIR